MREGTKTVLLEEGRVDEGIVKRAIVAAEEASPEDRIQAGLAVVIAEAETDPTAARLALRQLRADHHRLEQIEAWLGGDPDRATFGLGAAIQLLDTELACPIPNLEDLIPELLRWLESDW